GTEQTDGEGVEREWASLNPMAYSTREMGPGERHDAVKDCFAGWNEQKRATSLTKL
ncbi:hypothetical protein C8R43DRAFT_901661, partial [Mycena crocata]